MARQTQPWLLRQASLAMQPWQQQRQQQQPPQRCPSPRLPRSSRQAPRRRPGLRPSSKCRPASCSSSSRPPRRSSSSRRRRPSSSSAGGWGGARAWPGSGPGLPQRPRCRPGLQATSLSSRAPAPPLRCAMRLRLRAGRGRPARPAGRARRTPRQRPWQRAMPHRGRACGCAPPPSCLALATRSWQRSSMSEGSRRGSRIGRRPRQKKSSRQPRRPARKASLAASRWGG